jgi:hypothetical protein
MYKHAIISNQITINLQLNVHKSLFLDEKIKKLVNMEGCVI